MENEPVKRSRYEILAAMVLERNWKRGAEIGVFAGRTHLYLLDNCPALTLIGVDVWDMYPEFREGATKSGEKCRCVWCDETRADRRAEQVGEMRRRVIRSTSRFNGRSQIIIKPSVNAALDIEFASLDFVFIDGDHSMEGVRNDIMSWAPKVRPGGFIIGHDWNMASVRDGVMRGLSADHVVDRVSLPVAVDLDDHLWMARMLDNGEQPVGGVNYPMQHG